MKINLLIDGNYILNKSVFALDKVNELHGNLETLLHKSLNTFMTYYSFDNVYLVSDSNKSWRENIYSDYKGNRVKKSDIDWAFVYETYNNFKSDLPKRAKLFEKNLIEGDDWIAHLIKTEKDYSNLIISNDHDLKQLLSFTISPNQTITFMSNEMYASGKVFLPENYKTFLNALNDNISDNIFEQQDEDLFMNFFDKFIKEREEIAVDDTKEYIIKLIKGDKSDNIKSAYITQTKTGKDRGIGVAGANTIYDKYIEEFGVINLEDEDLYDNIADLICESKKVSYDKMDIIKNNLKFNTKLIDLKNLPSNIINIMNTEIDSMDIKHS